MGTGGLDMNENEKKIIKYVLSFCIPFIMYMIIGVLLKLYPFSDNTFLISDINNQFVHFYNFFKGLFETNNDFFYTFSKNLGGDMMGFSAYYLQNPFLFILLLFPYEYMPLGIYVMEAIMLSVASLTFMIYLEKVYGNGNILFSICYGMMGYVLAYSALPMYFCNIILLPLVITGFHLMMEDDSRAKDKILYIVSLAMSIFCNYYLGYMLCIFLVVYFIYYVGCYGGFRKIRTFAVCSILGVMLDCFDLVPVALSLRDQKDSPASSIFEMGRVFSFRSIFRNLLPLPQGIDYSNASAPYIYVGLIPLICVAFVFVSRKVKLSEKISLLFVFGVFAVSFYVKPLNTVWHAFNEPVGFAHRFAFYFSFVLLSAGYKGYLIAESFISEKRVTIKKVYISGTVLIFTLLELFFNAHHVLKLEVNSGANESDYIQFRDRIEAALDEIKLNEGNEALYRIEKDFQYVLVDAMAFDYAGLTHNSSCEKARVKDFMSKLGFRNQGIWAFYNQGSTAFADSFLAVKYFLSRFDTTDKPYLLLNNTDDTYVFQNPYALNLASIADNDRIMDLSQKMDEESDEYVTKAVSDISNKGNTFELQNEIAKCYGLDEEIFEEATISEIKINGGVEVSDAFFKHAQDKKVDINEFSGDEKEKSIEFLVDISEYGKTLYMYFLAPKKQGARIYVNDIDWDDYFSDWRWAVERVGTFQPGENVSIKIVATGDELIIDDYQLYFENPESLKKWHDAAKAYGANSVELTKKTSSHIVGKYNATNDGILILSIPDENGWKIKIDGETVPHKKVLYVLMGVETTAGEHTIDMRYIPEGLVLGTIFSVLAMCICFYLLYDKKAKDRL